MTNIDRGHGGQVAHLTIYNLNLMPRFTNNRGKIEDAEKYLFPT
jgi:hypothetical protein